MTYDEAIDFAREYGATYYEINVETGFNCEVLFADVAESLLDAKVAYVQRLRKEVKIKRKHGYKQFLFVVLFLYLCYVLAPTIQVAFIYSFYWLFLRNQFDICAEGKQPGIMGLPGFFGPILSYMVPISLFFYKTKKWLLFGVILNSVVLFLSTFFTIWIYAAWGPCKFKKDMINLA